MARKASNILYLYFEIIYKHISYLVKSDEINLPDLESLITILDIRFGNKYKKMEAE